MAMKSILDHVKGMAKSNEVIASFFIHGQGVELQKCILGLYRSLLHQLYSYTPESFLSLTERFERHRDDTVGGKQDEKWSWMKGEIRHSLLQGLRNACKHFSVMILVDALDEAGEVQAKEVFKDLEELVRSLRGSACKFHICVSCRHYPEIIVCNATTLVMEELNGPDIEKLLNAQIDALNIFNHAEKCQLQAEILERADGIFQWMSLIIDTIVRARERGESFEAAFREIDRVPRDLDLLYKRLLMSEEELIPIRELDQRRKLFQWVALAKRPLSPQEVQHALALDPNMDQKSIHDYMGTQTFIAESNLTAKVKNLSKGLIQLKGGFTSGRAEFIHLSVKDFLLENGGLQMLSRESTTAPTPLGLFEMSRSCLRSCLRYLFMAEIEDFLRHQQDDLARMSLSECSALGDPFEPYSKEISTAFPFISYAWLHWIDHAIQASRLGVDIGSEQQFINEDLCSLFQWPNDQPIAEFWITLHLILGSPLPAYLNVPKAFHPASLWPTPGSRLIHLLALTGLLGEDFRPWLSSDSSVLNFETADGVTPLMCAIAGEQVESSQWLIRAGANVCSNTRNPSLSPINMASLWGNDEIISSLIACEVKARSFYRAYFPRKVHFCTPLHFAATSGNVTGVQALLATGAKVNSKEAAWHGDEFPSYWIEAFIQGGTPLHFAARLGHVDVLECLLKSGAHVNATSLWYNTPLAYAAANNHLEAITLLIEHGAHVDGHRKSTRTPLIAALAMSHHAADTPRAAVQMLLEKGANPNCVYGHEKPLHAALRSQCSVEIVKLLLQHGAHVNAGGDQGQTPLHLAVVSEDIEMVNCLITHGADPNAKNDDQWSPLHAATKQRDQRIAWFLMGWGANISATSTDAPTTLRRAIHESHILLLKLLIKGRIDLNTRYQDGETPLFLAADIGEPEVVALLLDHGADPNARSNDGETALFRAVGKKPLFEVFQTKQIDVIRMLLQAGADPSATSTLGRTARSYSVKSEQHAVDKILEDAGVPVCFLGKDPAHRVLSYAIQSAGKKMSQHFIKWREERS